MATIVTIPDFDFSGFYYPQLLEALIQYKRRNVPELTDESEFEPFTQLIRAIALMGHLNNTLLDLVANEGTLPTAKLAESVRNMLRLIDYEMAPASPAQVDVLYELSKVFAAPYLLVSESAQASTQRAGSDPVIYFEALEALTIERTDQVGACFTEENGVFTDRTTDANSSAPGDDFAAWATPAMKDALYIGHANVMWDKIALTLGTTPAANIIGVWEFYDGNFRKTAPLTVTDLGGSLQFDLTTLLGSQNRQGTKVRIQLNETTAYQDVFTTWTGSANVAVTDLLGQSSPSTDATKYTVGSDWTILEEAEDGSLDFTQDGDVEFALPQTLAHNWRETTINGFTGFFIRYRVISVSTPTAPDVRLVRIDTGKQYALRSCTQGRTTTDAPLGSSNGQPSQRFDTSKENYVTNSAVVTVDGEAWTSVKNFLSSTSTDKHYVVELGEGDRATIVFGDGVTGRIPPLGVGNIAIDYRYGANDNGNVGANTVTVDKTGLTFINKIWNPRVATGWKEAAGASDASLARVKIEGPASLRTKDVALGPDDVVELTRRFTDDSGARPFGRAKAFEEGFGPKTIELVVVAAGGGLASNDQLLALEEYFNGDQFSVPPLPKHLVANQQVVAVNYTKRLIDVTATVYGNVTEEEVKNKLTGLLQPEALKEDGVTFEWAFGGEVPQSRISHEIFQTDPSITKVVVATPASDVALVARELPVAGTITITIVTP